MERLSVVDATPLAATDPNLATAPDRCTLEDR